MNKFLKNVFVYLMIIICAIWMIDSYSASTVPKTDITYTAFMKHVQQDEVKQVTIVENVISGKLKDGSDFTTVVPNDDSLIPTLRARDIEIKAELPPEPPWWMTVVSELLPILVIVAVWFFMMQQMQGGGGGRGVMNFGKSRARRYDEDNIKVTFKDVAGADEAKQELEEVVEFLKHPKKYNDLGAKIPKGVLLYGPPGTGKTLLAKAVAGEAGVPFFSISGSDFVEMFVGVGASRVRDLFEQAKKSAPCIVFIDEIDAVGRQRGAGLGGGHDEREQTLNQLLVEMDGFGANEGIIMIAATNRPDILDPALLRPGRFDRQIVVDRPDIKGRQQILKVHVKGKPVASDVELDVIARHTPGFTGADLSNLVNEAALMAARKNKKQINMPDMEEAAERVIMGPERRSRVISDKEKRLTAYHEGGHTLVGMLLDNADPVHKVTIIPRGRAGGYTLSLPKEDRYYATRSEMLDELKVRQMICEYGMSQELGPVTFGHRQDQVFLGRDIARDKNYSEEIAAKIDKEIRKFLDEAYQKTEELLQNNMDKLHLIAQALIEKETLEGSEIEQLMKYGRILDKNEQPPDDNSGTPAEIPPDVITVPAEEPQPQQAPQYQEVPGVVGTEEKHALN